MPGKKGKKKSSDKHPSSKTTFAEAGDKLNTLLNKPPVGDSLALVPIDLQDANTRQDIKSAFSNSEAEQTLSANQLYYRQHFYSILVRTYTGAYAITGGAATGQSNLGYALSVFDFFFGFKSIPLVGTVSEVASKMMKVAHHADTQKDRREAFQIIEMYKKLGCANPTHFYKMLELTSTIIAKRQATEIDRLAGRHYRLKENPSKVIKQKLSSIKKYYPKRSALEEKAARDACLVFLELAKLAEETKKSGNLILSEEEHEDLSETLAAKILSTRIKLKDLNLELVSDAEDNDGSLNIKDDSRFNEEDRTQQGLLDQYRNSIADNSQLAINIKKIGVIMRGNHHVGIKTRGGAVFKKSAQQPSQNQLPEQQPTSSTSGIHADSAGVLIDGNNSIGIDTGGGPVFG